MHVVRDCNKKILSVFLKYFKNRSIKFTMVQKTNKRNIFTLNFIFVFSVLISNNRFFYYIFNSVLLIYKLNFSLKSLIVYVFILKKCNRLIEKYAWFQLKYRCERNVIILLSTHTLPSVTTTNDDKNTLKFYTKCNNDIDY